jgi:predicted RNA methylase
MPPVLDYHRELLADEARTNAFRDAIGRTVKPGDVVIDLGCGSGILSFFACQAGAARVYAIDQTEAAEVARYLARQLGFADRITVLRKPSREVELPEQAQVLISETLGVFGLDEGIASSVIDARQRMLRADARILPSHVGLSIMPVELDYDYDRRVASWSEPQYGFDLSPMRVFASNNLFFAHIRSNAYIADPVEAFTAALHTIEGTEFTGTATFTAARDAQLHGFGAFFTATLAPGIRLTNRGARSTSWSQGFLPLEEPIAIRAGDSIEAEVQTDDGRSWRWRGTAAGVSFDQTTWLAVPPAGM